MWQGTAGDILYLLVETDQSDEAQVNIYYHTSSRHSRILGADADVARGCGVRNFSKHYSYGFRAGRAGLISDRGEAML